MLRLSCSDQPKGRDTLFAMNTITQTMRLRQAVITYSEKYGVTKAAIRYWVSIGNTSTVGKSAMTVLSQSLADRSHRPHSHPNQHTPEETNLYLKYAPQKPPYRGWLFSGSSCECEDIPDLFLVISLSSQTRADGSKNCPIQNMSPNPIEPNAISRSTCPD